MRTRGQIFYIMFTSHDIDTSIQLSTDYNLTVCIFESRHRTSVSQSGFLGGACPLTPFPT